MGNIRKLIRETLENSIIFEGAKTFMEFGPNIGLVANIPSTGQLHLNFIDFAELKCVGTITLRNDKDIWYVTTVSSEKGFGPLMYKSGMMAVYPDKISPTRLDTPSNDAINVWHKFFVDSGEVKKEAIPEDNYLYKNFGNDDLNIILNQSYSRPRSTWFNKMLQKGEYFSKQKNVTPDMARRICSDYFREKYQNR